MQEIEENTYSSPSLAMMREAATKIQAYYRHHFYKQKFQAMLTQMRKKESFYRGFYAYRDGKKTRKILLIGSCVSSQMRDKDQGLIYRPNIVIFQFYDNKNKKIVYQCSCKMENFGIKKEETVVKLQLFNKIKAMLSRMSSSGSPQKDINDAMKFYNFKKITKDDIGFVDPVYFDGALAEVKKIQLKEPQKMEQVEYEIADEEDYHNEFEI